MKKLFLVSLIIVFLMSVGILPVQTQTILPGLIANPAQVFTEPSPNAGAFQNIDVDLFHGSCNISIPLCRFQGTQLDVPVSLNYSSSRAYNFSANSEYFPGWVGRGWSLSLGFDGYFGGRLIGFSIQFSDGTIYTFGGTDSAIEYSAPINNRTELVETSWMLTQINSPTKDIVDLIYERGTPICSLSWPKTTDITSVYKEKVFYGYGTPYTKEEYYSSHSTESDGNFYIKPSYLKRILFYLGNMSVEFDRSVSNEPRYPSGRYTLPWDFSSMNWYKLDFHTRKYIITRDMMVV